MPRRLFNFSHHKCGTYLRAALINFFVPDAALIRVNTVCSIGIHHPLIDLLAFVILYETFAYRGQCWLCGPWPLHYISDLIKDQKTAHFLDWIMLLISCSEGKAWKILNWTGLELELRVRVPFRPQLFRPFFHCSLRSIAKLLRSLTLQKLFLSAVQVKFH